MKHRLPRKVDLGKGYVCTVEIMSAKSMRDDLDEDENTCDGYWVAAFEPLPSGKILAGKIVIWNGLKYDERWKVYWHEMIHALNDIAAHDSRPSVAT